MEISKEKKKRGRKKKVDENCPNNDGIISNVNQNLKRQNDETKLNPLPSSVVVKKKRGRRKKCERDMQSCERITGYVENGPSIDTQNNEITFCRLNTQKDQEKEQEENKQQHFQDENKEFIAAPNLEVINFGPLRIYRQNESKPKTETETETGLSLPQHQASNSNFFNDLCQINLPTIDVIKKECEMTDPFTIEKSNVVKGNGNSSTNSQQSSTTSILSKKAIGKKAKEYLTNEKLNNMDLNVLDTSKNIDQFNSNFFQFTPDKLPYTRKRQLQQLNKIHQQESPAPLSPLKKTRALKEHTVLFTYKGCTTVYPKSTNILCWWCCHSFDKQPRFIPTRYDDIRQRYQIQGNFCSWECAKSYLINDKGNYFPCTNLHHFTSMVKKIMGKTMFIKCAPPRQWLKSFGGTMTIEEFRKTFTEYDVEYTIICNDFILDENFRMAMMMKAF